MAKAEAYDDIDRLLARAAYRGMRRRSSREVEIVFEKDGVVFVLSVCAHPDGLSPVLREGR